VIRAVNLDNTSTEVLVRIVTLDTTVPVVLLGRLLALLGRITISRLAVVQARAKPFSVGIIPLVEIATGQHPLVSRLAALAIIPLLDQLAALFVRLGITATHRLRVAQRLAILALMHQGREARSNARIARLVLSTIVMAIRRAASAAPDGITLETAIIRTASSALTKAVFSRRE